MKTCDENGDSTVEITIEDVQRLIKKKDNMEEQIKVYYDVLEDQGVDMTAPLVDVEGYPRSDVDLYQIRTARHSISCLQNDHKAIMLEIEQALHKLHARDRAKRELDGVVGPVGAQVQQKASLPVPFAQVESITPGSPASQAGLQVGDEIIVFGTVNCDNFKNLQNISSVVQHSEGKSLSITVIRSGQSLHLGLIPQRWSGKGLLGCNIVPLRR